MKLSVVLIVLATFATSAAAQSATSVGLVAFQCKQINSTNLSTSTVAAGLCTLLLRGFADGLRVGANRGIRTAFIDDSQNLATTKGIDDLQFRAGLVRAKAQCLPPQATIGQLTEVFVRFMDAHPERKDEPYSEPLTYAIESYFCPR
jgi:Rap1a immunity proteins